MITVQTAREIILKEISPTNQTESVNFSSCLGRVSAVDVKSKDNIPPFNNSAMDGFAIRAVDSAGASKDTPSILKVIEDLPAGYPAKNSIRQNQAVRIMTGAPMPKGADSVVMVEDTRVPRLLVARNDAIAILKEAKPGENVRYAGEDVKKSEIVIKKGSALKSGHIGMLASLGIPKIKVFGKPKVAILATGDELVEIRERLMPGKIRNSNSYSLYAQVLRLPAIPHILGIAKDNKRELKQKIGQGLRGKGQGLSKADMLLISGGVSVGDYDFVKDVLADLGMDMKFWKVAMRPGKPLAFGKIGAVPIFGLPGNPVSSMIAFEQFVRPAILKMAGARDLFRFHLPAIIKEGFRKKKGLRYFLRAVLENPWPGQGRQNGTLYAYLTGPQGSGILKSMVLANGIVELPEDTEEVRQGDKVQVTYLD